MEEELDESSFEEEETDDALTYREYEDHLLGQEIGDILKFDPYENAYSRAVTQFGFMAEQLGLESDIVSHLREQFHI
jgi:hypothetical protein